jgi:hypothetical protein
MKKILKSLDPDDVAEALDIAGDAAKGLASIIRKFSE